MVYVVSYLIAECPGKHERTQSTPHPPGNIYELSPTLRLVGRTLKTGESDGFDVIVPVVTFVCFRISHEGPHKLPGTRCVGFDIV